MTRSRMRSKTFSSYFYFARWHSLFIAFLIKYVCFAKCERLFLNKAFCWYKMFILNHVPNQRPYNMLHKLLYIICWYFELCNTQTSNKKELVCSLTNSLITNECSSIPYYDTWGYYINDIAQLGLNKRNQYGQLVP